MTALYIALGIIAFVVILVLTVSLVTYFMAFYSPKRKECDPDEYKFDLEELYAPYKPQMIEWMKWARSLNPQTFEIKSHDGLKLVGKYYEYDKNAPIEILFHGYRGCGERDLSGGIERCFKIGRNALIVDQRAAGMSEGHTITFGIKEHLDCIKWAEFVSEKFGKDKKIILTGVSMGAATVLMASGKKLPDNVKCILADCPYSSPREIIMKTIKEMKLPPKLMYPFVKLGARIFGSFNLDEYSPMEAVKESKVPTIFIHGTVDDFVPYSMSEKMYEECTNEIKSLVPIEDAGHGLAYPVNNDLYLNSLRDFEKMWDK
ncbi:MAG: alpha/beta hydrolase [Clostridia bacterium]|nr:alpha/beta hydrolase [Clostridia bacterium]